LGAKALPVLLDLLRIKQPRTLRGPDESRKSLLSLDKGHLPQVLTIKPQKVERVKDWLAFPAEQLAELAHTFTIEAHNLAIENCGFDRQLGERFFQRFKSQVALIARNQLRLAVLQVTRSPGNRRVLARKCSRDGRRAAAPDGAAWGECEGAQLQSTLECASCSERAPSNIGYVEEHCNPSYFNQHWPCNQWTSHEKPL